MDLLTWNGKENAFVRFSVFLLFVSQGIFVQEINNRNGISPHLKRMQLLGDIDPFPSRLYNST